MGNDTTQNGKPMNWFHTTCILLAALVCVFLEAAVTLPRDLFGAQVNPLPALVVYTALQSNVATLTLLVVCGSLWQSSLSADPPGIALLPLFLVGVFIEFNRRQFVRREHFVRFTLGTAASASVPLLTLFLLLTIGHEPILNWFSLWQWLVVSVGGGISTLLAFLVLDWLKIALSYNPKKRAYLMAPDADDLE
jgi:hypothetical protein